MNTTPDELQISSVCTIAGFGKVFPVDLCCTELRGWLTCALAKSWLSQVCFSNITVYP